MISLPKSLSLTLIVSRYKLTAFIIGMKPSNINKLAQVAGKLIQKEEIDEEMFVTRKYLHFRVEVNVHEPIASGVKIQRKLAMDTGNFSSKIWLEFRYKRIPDFCFKCDRLNHLTNERTLAAAVTY